MDCCYRLQLGYKRFHVEYVLFRFISEYNKDTLSKVWCNVFEFILYNSRYSTILYETVYYIPIPKFQAVTIIYYNTTKAKARVKEDTYKFPNQQLLCFPVSDSTTSLFEELSI